MFEKRSFARTERLTFWGPIREPATSQPHESSRVMSTTESLRLMLDNANGEIQRLEAENRRLREAHPERVAEAELSTEVQRLKELYKQALEDIRKKDEQAEESRRLLEETTESLRSQEMAVQEAQTKCRDLEEKMGAVREQVTQVRDAGELERHRAVRPNA